MALFFLPKIKWLQKLKVLSKGTFIKLSLFITMTYVGLLFWWELVFIPRCNLITQLKASRCKRLLLAVNHADG